MDKEGSPFLRVGDWLSLFCDDDNVRGYIVCEGFADENTQFRLIRPKEDSVRNFQDAVFEVHVFKNYAALGAYHRFLDSKGMDASSSSMHLKGPGGGSASRLDDDDELGQLKKRYESEVRYNEDLQQRSLGQYVCYGHVVEFMHIKTGKYLRVEPAVAAEGNSGALAVRLGEQDDQCRFKILPRYKLHSEGERVHVGDQIVMQNEKTNHNIHLQSSIVLDSLHREINAIPKLSNCGFQVMHYAPFFPPAQAEEFMNGGEVVRFYNKENDGYLVVEELDASSPGPEPHLHATREARNSSNALFMIEHQHSSNGGFVNWKDILRLRHVGTGSYLTVFTVPEDEDAKARASSYGLSVPGRGRGGAVSVAAAGEGEGQEEEEEEEVDPEWDPERVALLKRQRVGMTDNINDPGTRFTIEAFYKEEADGNMNLHEAFRLRSHFADAYLHFTEQVFKEEPEVKPHDQQDDDDDDDDMIGEVVTNVGKRKKIRMTLKAYDEDTLVFVKVGNDVMANLNEVKGVIPTLVSYADQFESGRLPDRTPRGITYRVHRILRSLLLFVQEVPPHKVRDDPLKLDEPPVAAKQKVMKEQGMIDVIMRVLDAPFGLKDGRKGVMSLKDIKTKAEFKPYFVAAQLSYRLVKQTIKENEECRLYLSTPESVDLMQSHLGYQLKTADTLMELFRNNGYLLARLTDKNIAVFLHLIQSVGKLSRYMNFLNALITCNGEGLTSNQRRICDLLFVQHRDDCLIYTKLEGGEVYVDLESVKKKAERGQPQWLLLGEFVKKCAQEQLEYFERTLTCLSNLCLGRNNFCIGIVSSLLPYSLCFKGATDESLRNKHFRIRAAFLRILQTVYVDTDPHEKVAQLNLTRTWQGFDVDVPKSKHLTARVKGPIVVRDHALPPQQGSAERSLIAPDPSSSSSRMFGGKAKATELTTLKREKPPRSDRRRSTTGLMQATMLEQKMFAGVDFSPLKEFVVSWLENCSRQVADEIEHNEMTLSCLDLLAELLRFGFFGDIKELVSLVEPLIECLDGRDDVQSADQKIDKDGARFLKTTQNMVIMACKKRIIQIFDILSDLRADYRLSLLLKLFEDKMQSGEYRQLDEKAKKQREQIDKHRASVVSGGAAAAGAGGGPEGRRTSKAAFMTPLSVGGNALNMGGNLVKSLGSRIMRGNEDDPKFLSVFTGLQWQTRRGRNLVEILLDCTRYDSRELVSTAFAMLIRNYSQRLLMLSALQNTQVLASGESSQVYHDCRQSVRTITAIINPSMTQEDEIAIKECTLQLEGCALDAQSQRPIPVNQQILRSVGAHTVAHRLLRLPFSNDLPKEQARREVFLSCYRLLKNFAKGNAVNQALLLESVPFYMSQMGVKLKAADTLTEIFRDNRQVCSQVQESTIRHIVTIIDERGRFPRYLKFFQILLKPEGRPVARNQELILKALLEKATNCMVLFKDEKGRQERRQLIADNDHKVNEEGLLNYHTTLIELFGQMVEGQNRATIAKCKVWLSVEHTRSHIEEAGLPLFVRTPFITFFLECYVLTSRAPDTATLNEMWAVMVAIKGVLRQCVDEVGTGSPHALPCFREVCRLIQGFFGNSILMANDWRRDEAVEFAQTFSETLKALDLGNDPKICKAAKEAVAALVGTNTSAINDALFPSIEVDEDALLEAQNAEMVGKVVRDAEDQRIVTALSVFTDEYRLKLHLLEDDGFGSNEFMQLMQIFMDEEPERTEALPWTPYDAEEADWTGANLNTMKLINQVQQLRDELSLKRTCLKIVENLAEFEDEFADPPVTRAMSQNRLDKLGEYSRKSQREKTCGATRMVLRMMIDPVHQHVLKEVLEVGIALLTDGNQNAQDRVYKYFRSEKGLMFFESVQGMVRQGAIEVKDLLAHHKRAREIKAAMAGASEQEIQAALPIFFERTQMQLLLRFIQLTAEGHNRKIQNYWRTQNARRTYDIVTDISDYLHVVFNAGIDSDTVPYALQCLQTLTELMQGPCVGNQRILAGSKLPATCSKILAGDFPNCSMVDAANLKEETALCMSSMLEGCTDVGVPLGLSNEFNLDHLLSMLTDAFLLYKKSANKHSEEVEEALETAFQIYCFILTLSDFVPAVEKLCEEHFDSEAAAWYHARTGKIEVNLDGQLSRVYFRLPDLSSRLTERSKQQLLWSVDRSSATKKLDDFLEKAEELEAEMVHQQEVTRNPLVSRFTSDKFTYYINTVALLLALFINCMMVGSYDVPEDSHVSHITDKIQFLVIYVAGIMLGLLEVVRFVQFLTIRAALIIRKGYKQYADLVEKIGLGPDRQRDSLNPLTKTKKLGHVVLSALFLLLDPKFTVELALLVFSVIGWAISPLSFCVHLTLYLIEVSQDLQNVLKSVTLNGRSLVITALFGVLLVYVMSIWAFVSFRDHYFDDDGNNQCENLFQCTVISFNGGLRKGDIGEVLSDTEWGDGEFIVFQLMYFAVIITIMLNIIFGIIIDTFGELRQIKADTEDDIQNKCFICSIDRYTFDRLTEGFEHHIKNEHNMWEYLFFMVHLNHKDPNDYTGPESFVRECVDQSDGKWLPVNQALTLAEHLKKEKEAQTELTSAVNTTVSQSKELVLMMTKMQTQLNDLEVAIARVDGNTRGQAAPPDDNEVVARALRQVGGGV